MVKSLNSAKNDILIVEKNQKISIQTLFLKESTQLGKIIFANFLDKVLKTVKSLNQAKYDFSIIEKNQKISR